MPTIVFSPNLLEKSFTTNEWKKGLRLFNSNNVFNCVLDDNTIRGVVHSERNYKDKYLTRIEYHEKSGNVDSFCNCFVGYDCKHGAALAHQFIRDKFKVSTETSFTAATPTLNQPKTNASSKSLVNSWLNNFQTENLSHFSSARAFLYFLKHSRFEEDGYLSVEVKSSRAKKNGGWSKALNNEYISTALIASEIASAEDLSALTGITRNNHNYRHNVTTYELFEHIINTQRCYWQEDYHLDHPIILGEPIAATWQWIQIEEGLQTLKLQLEHPDENIQIIKAQPLCYYNSRNSSFGKINTNTQCKFEAELLQAPILDEEQLPWVISKLKLSLGESAKNFPSPTLSTEIEITKPVIHLHFTTPIGQQGKTGNVQVTFGYSEHLISPYDDNAKIKSSSGEVSIYRDKIAEYEAIELLKSHRFTELSRGYFHRKTPDFIMMLQGRLFWHSFLHQGLPLLKDQGWQISFDDNFYYKELSTNNVFEAEIIHDEDSHDFFSLGLNLEIDGKKMPAFPILYSAIQQLPKSVLLQRGVNNDIPHDAPIFIDLEEGEFIALSYQSVQPLLAQFVELFMPGALNKATEIERASCRERV